METSSNIHGKNVFVRFEGTDIIQITNITFIITDIQHQTLTSELWVGLELNYYWKILNTRSTRHNIPKNGLSSDSSTDWTLVSL